MQVRKFSAIGENPSSECTEKGNLVSTQRVEASVIFPCGEKQDLKVEQSPSRWFPVRKHLNLVRCHN